MSALIAGTGFFVIAALVAAVAHLWRERRIEKDRADAWELNAGEWSNAYYLLRHRQADDDTVPLPAWQEFLDPHAAHDRAVVDAMERQFEEGR